MSKNKNCECKMAIENLFILHKIRPDEDIAVLCLICDKVIRVKGEE